MAAITTGNEPLTKAERLQRTWQGSSGVIGWLSEVNHKSIATRYIITSIVFFFLAGVSALIMRLQLAQPELELISPELYNQLFSTHGTAMMFLFAIPILEAVGMYLIPLMIGSRDMIFPRLNAFGYYVYVIAGITVWTSLFLGNGPNAAWFNYVPLSNNEYSPGMGVDVWTTAITFMEIAALVAAVEMIATIFKMRAPGMSLNRMPIFVWAMLVMSFMIIFAMPAVMLASVMLLLDRTVGTGFFEPAMGGDPLLWQHLFWVFGHPEVYIILIPGLGMVSAIVSGFAKRENAAYSLLAASFVAIGVLSFGLWVHHMYTAGLPWLSLSFFEAASMSIAIPSGIAIFSWIATLWGTRPAIKTPLMFILGFFFIFILGGITGVMVASIQFNHQVHDTYFVVAHFHYVIIGSAVFPLFGALHYWFPKLTGKMLDETIGRISFWLLFGGFNLTFFPMHISGFLGMPRQVYTYQADLGWEIWNLLSTIGAFIMGFGAVVVLINIIRSIQKGEDAGSNPWGAGTLEWATSSPPPPYNWEELPRVTGKNPLWTNDEDGRNDPSQDRMRILGEDVFPEDPERRESPGTRLLDSRLERKAVVATSSIWPFFSALSVGILFIGTMFSLWFVPAGAVLAYVSIVAWLWPAKEEW